MSRGKLLLLLAVPLFSQTPQALDDQQAIQKFDSLIASGQLSAASDQLTPYIAAHPNSWRAMYQLGYVFFRQHKIGPSLTLISKSLAINSNFGEAHKILAFDLNILGRKDLAATELREAIRLTPDPWESHYELGRLLFEQGFYGEAIDHFEKTKQLKPDFVKTYHNLGLAYGAVNDDTKAVANFEEALARNRKQPEPSAWPLIDYATYLNQRNQFARARDLLLEAEQINASWAQEFEELSKSYRGLGQMAEAIQCLEKAIRIDPSKPENHYALAMLYRQTQRPDDAKRELSLYEKIHDAKASSEK